MAEQQPDPVVRIIGSRELHQNLSAIMRDLENNADRFVLTVHGRPRAVLVAAATYLDLIRGSGHPCEAIIELQLSALLGMPPVGNPPPAPEG